jgi:hypothetical protein
MALNYSQTLNKPPPHTSLTTFTSGVDDVVSAKLTLPPNNVSIGSSNHLFPSLPKMWPPPSPSLKKKPLARPNSLNSFITVRILIYMVLPDAPRPVPFGQDKPGMSHSADGLIGNTTHHNPQPQQPPMYGIPQYPPAYGGNPLLSSSPLSTTIPCCPASTHKWTPADTHNMPTYPTKFWYPLYLSLYPKH